MDVLSDLTGRKENNMLEKRLNEWVQAVMDAYNDDRDGFEYSVNTYQMIVEVDKIISEEFDHEPVLKENW